MTPTTGYDWPFSCSVSPLMSRAPNWRRQSASERIAARGPPGTPSSAVNVRPCPAATPNVGNSDGVTTPTRRRSGRSGSDRLSPPAAYTATCGNVRPRSMATTSSTETSRGPEGDGIATPGSNGTSTRGRSSSRDGSRNGSGRSSAASTALNIAVVAPMPSANTPTTDAVKPGRCMRRRTPKRTSASASSSQRNPHASRLASVSATALPNPRHALTRASPGDAPAASSVRARCSRCRRISSSSSAVMRSRRRRASRRRQSSPGFMRMPHAGWRMRAIATETRW